MAENEFPKVDGDVLYASEANQFEANIRYNPIFYNNVNTATALIGHSATDWTTLENVNVTITSDAGATWSTPSTDIVHNIGAVTKVDSNTTNAMVCRRDNNETSLTTDSGDNWAEKGSIITNATAGISISAPTTSVAVVGLDIGTATRGIAFSTDNTANWTVCSTGPAVDVPVIDMVDSSNGIAIDVNGNIWTTSDGGDNWTDSGQASANNPTITSYMIALTSTTYVMKHSHTSNFIETGNTTSGGTVKSFLSDMNNSDIIASNLVKTTSGNLYCAVYFFKTGASNSQTNITMYKSKDSGATWSVGALPNVGFGSGTVSELSSLDEYAANKLLLMVSDAQIMTIDETWDS